MPSEIADYAAIGPFTCIFTFPVPEENGDHQSEDKAAVKSIVSLDKYVVNSMQNAASSSDQLLQL